MMEHSRFSTGIRESLSLLMVIPFARTRPARAQGSVLKSAMSETFDKLLGTPARLHYTAYVGKSALAVIFVRLLRVLLP